MKICEPQVSRILFDFEKSSEPLEKMFLKSVLLSCVMLIATASAQPTFIKVLRGVSIRVDNLENHSEYTVFRDDKVLQNVTVSHAFGEDAWTTDIENGFELTGNGQTIRFESLSNHSEFSLIRVTRNVSSTEIASDCLPLSIGRTAWYGGPSLFHRYWPIEKVTLTNYSMVSKTQEGSAIAERYWLNSNGVFIYIDPITPFFVNQNVGHNNSLCLSAQNSPPYNVRRDQISLVYFIGVHMNTRLVHLEAVNRFLGKPVDLPDRRMIQHPIWSTWARYKKDINETIVETFAGEILANGFQKNTISIDDNWESCYGSLSFNVTRFPNVAAIVGRLKQRGFRVTLWVHPFINIGCEPWYSEARRLG